MLLQHPLQPGVACKHSLLTPLSFMQGLFQLFGFKHCLQAAGDKFQQGHGMTERFRSGQAIHSGLSGSRLFGPPGVRKIARSEYWESTAALPVPRIAVIQDLDSPSGTGSFWGEVNANIHRALGFVGAVTNGGVRDLEEMEGLGFAAFARVVSVSHAYVHLVDFGGPVRVGGAVVRPGDLLHGDAHGVLIIPHEIAPAIAEAAAHVEAAERELISYCRGSEFSLDGLKHAAGRLENRFLEIARALKG